LRAPFPRIDLGLCRNVLIYFTPELQKRALRLFAFSIRPGGYFVLGKAETATPLPEYFEPHESRLRLSRRRATPAPVPPAQAVSPPSRSRPQRAVSAARERPPRRAEVASRAEGLDDGLLASLAIGAVLVGEHYEVRQVNAAARRILGIHSAAVGQDLLHLVERLPAGELRGLLESGLRGTGERRIMRLIGPQPPDETLSRVEITVDPAPDPSERRALISIREAPAEVVGEPARSGGREPAHPSQRRLLAAEDVSRRLLRDNEELTRLNAELRAANEEMLLGQEEAQAATEEVETLNEELQATNEELETLNEELQATVEELNTTGEDMQARTVELQLLATHLDEQRRVSETERLRFELLVESLTDAVALIDRSGSVVIRNEAYRVLLEEDGFQPLDEESQPLAGGNLRRRVAEGETFTVQFAARSTAGQRRWYEAYGRPVPSDIVTGGGILVVHDTTDLSLRRLQEEFVAIVAHELRTPLTALRGYIQLLRRTVARSEANDLDGMTGSDVTDGADAASAGASGRSQRLLGLAEEQAERLARLVEELFDVTRADTGRLVVSPEPVPLRSIIETTVEIAQSLSDQRIEVEGVDDSLVEVDGPRIQQVLLNLLTNAQRHAASSETVTVRARRLRRWLSIEVEDHGPGMSDELRESLFSRFHVDPSSPGRGLGLGLYISRQIAAAHGGTIEVDSAPGEGTTFTIRLPLVMSRPAAGDGAVSRTRTGSRPAPTPGER
jgi:two-component system CheB/CheR fusion protein